MAWPSTPLTTYVANFAPPIKAADLNSFQTGINGIVNGTYSLKGIKVDGTGGAIVAATAGSVEVSRLVSGTTKPTTTVALGELCRPLVPIGWAVVDSAGALQRGVNVSDVQHPAVGEFRVIFNTSPTDRTNACALATLKGAPFFVMANCGDDAGKIRATVATYNSAGIAADAPFQVVLFAE